MSLRTPLGRVRGLGSAKEGVTHWWLERMSALALVPLTFWFAASLAMLAGADHATISAWIASPLVAGLLILVVATTFVHGYLGLQTVIEDYVHHEAAKIAGLLAVKAGCILLGLVGVLSILILLFQG